jgi:hypothetical protein
MKLKTGLTLWWTFVAEVNGKNYNTGQHSNLFRLQCLEMWHCAFSSIPHENGHVHTEQTRLPDGQQDEGAPLAHLSRPSGQVNHGGGGQPPTQDTLCPWNSYTWTTLSGRWPRQSHPNTTNSENALHPNKPWKLLSHSPGPLGWGLLPGCQGCVHCPPPQWPTSATYHLLITPLEQIMTLFRWNTNHSICSYQPSLRF